MMKRVVWYYVVCWLVFLAVFNTIAFLIPNVFAWENKFTGSFWIAYGAIMIAFLGQLACACIAFRSENAEKLFLNISLVSQSYSALIAMLVVGSVFIVIPSLPSWIGAVGCSAILAFSILSVMKAAVSIDAVVAVGEKTAINTKAMKTMAAEVAGLVELSSTETIKTKLKKVYEEIRYSDPVSNETLEEIEWKIKVAIAELRDAVNQGDEEKIDQLSQKIVAMIKQRNQLCKLSK